MAKFKGKEWTQGMIEDIWVEIEKAAKVYDLDYYPPRIEIISSEQMLDNYCSVAMPVMYPHWSFGKQFMREAKNYKSGKSGLAFEVVINSNPSISYIMNSNSLCLQILVLAHAGVGHSSFFKNNYMFKQYTDASTIIDFLVYARDYISQCEEKYGIKNVERILDAAHALQSFSIDKILPPKPKTSAMIATLNQAKEDHALESAHFLWDSLFLNKTKPKSQTNELREDNILKFIQQHSAILENWEKNIIGIILYLAQYFYPQMQTQVGNEGFATFWHYQLMNDLYDNDIIDEGIMLEFIDNHNAVIAQQIPFRKHPITGDLMENPYFSGFNPYYLGFNIYSDVKRISTNPTDFDKRTMPNFIGKDWVDNIKELGYNFVDDGFIMQGLSPALMDKLKLFTITEVQSEPYYLVEDTSSESHYQRIKTSLSNQYNLHTRLPELYIYKCDLKGERCLDLLYNSHNGEELHKVHAQKTIGYIRNLWGHTVAIRDKETKKLLFWK
jgi:stage V sporulation protein R